MENQKFQMNTEEIEMIRNEANNSVMDNAVTKLTNCNEANEPYLFDKSDLKSFVDLIPQAIYESVKPYSKLDELLFEIEEYLISQEDIEAEEALIFQAEAF